MRDFDRGLVAGWCSALAGWNLAEHGLVALLFLALGLAVILLGKRAA